MLPDLNLLGELFELRELEFGEKLYYQNETSTELVIVSKGEVLLRIFFAQFWPIKISVPAPRATVAKVFVLDIINFEVGPVPHAPKEYPQGKWGEPPRKKQEVPRGSSN